MQAALFANKTMIFLVKKEIVEDSKMFPITKVSGYRHYSINLFKNLDESCAGILLFITNEYCGTEATKIFRR